MFMTPKTGASSPMDLIPRGYLCWAKLTFTGMKVSTQTGSRYGEIDLTVADGQPYARKKIFTRVADPDFEANTQGYRDMGMVALTRMVEAAGIVDPKDATSYEKLNGKSCEAVLALLDDKYVAIKIKVDPGKDGYPDKNEVGEFLTPNEASQSAKNFLKLLNGDHGVTANPAMAQKQTGFGATPVATAPKPTGFSGSSQPPAQEARGFNPNAAPPFLKAGQ
jgi:hypothetical protein